jgi:hypothetical protein
VSPEEQLLALIVYSQSAQMSGAKTSIDLNAEQMEKVREQVKKALDEAQQAKKDSGFWADLSNIFGSDVVYIAEAVAAAAAVVVTGGAAAAILAVIAAAAMLASKHAKELGIPPEVGMAIAVAASVAALCCGNAGGLTNLATTAQQVASKVSTVAKLAAAAGAVAGGGCQIEAGKYEKAAGNFHADARAGDGHQIILSLDMDDALARFSAAMDHQNDAVTLTSGIQQQSAASNQELLNNWGGAA